LDELPGIGSDLAGKICTILETGTLPLLQELTAKTPESLVQMLRIPGLGPKRAKQIYDMLGITTLEALEAAARAGQLRELPGIKGTIEQKILQGLADLRGHSGRWRLADAGAYVQPLVAHLKASPVLAQLEVAGSYRRRKDTVGDIDILVVSSRPAVVVRQFTSYPRVKQVQAEGPTRSAVMLDCGLQVDLRVVPAASFGSALHYFTGSKPHNIAIRALGLKRGLKINEYGFFRGTRRIGGRTEEEVFAAVGLPWIPPELREARGEIEAARAGRLPYSGRAFATGDASEPQRKARCVTMPAIANAAMPDARVAATGHHPPAACRGPAGGESDWATTLIAKRSHAAHATD
jgi:DNA polymerase (family 10)